MDKNQSLYMTLVVVFCVVLAGGGCFYLGTKMSAEKQEKCSDNIVDVKDNTKKEEMVFEVLEYPYTVNNILYNYLKSNSKSLDDYLNNLSNNNKLYLAGIIAYNADSDFENESLNKLKQNLIKYFGSDLNLKGEDFYIASSEIPLYKYDENKGSFYYNEDIPGGCINIDIDTTEIYNYKLDTIENKDDSIILTYYGLYAMPDEIGPTTVTNNKNIERVLNYDQDTDGLTDEYYLSEAFDKNKNDFFKFIYTYKLVDGKYVLVDFKQA